MKTLNRFIITQVRQGYRYLRLEIGYLTRYYMKQVRWGYLSNFFSRQLVRQGYLHFFSISQCWSKLILSLRSYSTDFKRVICILRVPFIFNMKIISKCESLKIITLIIFRGCRLTRFSKSVLTTTTSSEPCITFLLLRIGKTKICICILILYSTQISKVLLKLTPTLADVHHGDN